MTRRALISIFDKTGVVNFAKDLINLGWEIISTGGTRKTLENAGLKVIDIEQITGFPEILDGRVKTLHPIVHGGLLSLRNNSNHIQQLKQNKIDYIDMVVVNLYPFIETVKKINVKHEEIIENIDIGGPSMLRSAAKNYQSVTVICDINDYSNIIDEIKKHGDTLLSTREKLATKVFQITAYYDANIAKYFNEKNNILMPEFLTLPFKKTNIEMRYGENPHQIAAFYEEDEDIYLSLARARQIQGKQLSYNNIQDASAALQIMSEFLEPIVIAVKHANPCGVGSGLVIDEAWQNCYDGDPISIFGGIVVTNQEINESTAKKMSEIFLEIIIAPSFSTKALSIFANKKNLRVLQLDLKKSNRSKWQHVSVNGGILRQEWDSKNIDDCELKNVTKKVPTNSQLNDLIIAQKIVKHVKSNAIVIVKNKQLIGVGAGQMNRIGAAKIALEKAKEKCQGAVLASDAFFPFDDVIKLASHYKIGAIVQPGGSINDKNSIQACNDYEIAMVFTQMRHFKH